MAQLIRILGIDPGSTATGWGVVDREGARLSFVAAGVIRPSKKVDHPARLAQIYNGLCDVLTDYRPCAAAVEETFVNASPRDALILGQARGIALLAPANVDIEVAEYAANSVKKSVVGKGHADKTQVQTMVRVLLPSSGVQPADAADALAVAICHAHHMDVKNLAAGSMRVSA